VTDLSREAWFLQSLATDGSVEREVAVGDGVLEIGRRGEGFACPDDAQMADRHARLGAGEAGLSIEDLGAGSGVWIRVRGADGRPLANNDQVWLGAQILVIREGLEGWQINHHGPDGRLSANHAIPPTGLFIGRTSELVLDAADGQLSRRHAQIVMTEGRPTLFDRGAHNGTYFRLSRPEPLEDGAEFRIATGRFRVVAGGSELDVSEITEALSASDDDGQAAAAAEGRAPREAFDPFDEVSVLSDTVDLSSLRVEPKSAPGALEESHGRDSADADSGGRRGGLAARLRKIGGRAVESQESAPKSGLVLLVIDSASGSVSLEVEAGKTILEAVQEAGLERGEPVDWECGDGGCGVCVVGIVEGASRIDPPDPATGEMKTIQITEQVAPDPNLYRLACVARVRGTVRVRKLT
jgi:ferredoxin/pSer/pThr/pTyr-binding forkhead associated (FHA) protein